MSCFLPINIDPTVLFLLDLSDEIRFHYLYDCQTEWFIDCVTYQVSSTAQLSLKQTKKTVFFSMHLAALIVIIPTLIAKICLAGMTISSSEVHRSRLVEASLDILESCYTSRTDTVGLGGAAIKNVIGMSTLRDAIIPVTVIDETSRLVDHDPFDDAKRHKLQVFVITVTNSSNLVKTLIQVKNSKWWNHMASFILIDLQTDMKNGCSKAYEILWEAWKMNLLNSKFLCIHPTRGMLIYTFNPYASKAPVPWQQENTYRGINDHVWTLFVREYREDESCCAALDYDKTLDLGGYKIRATVSGMENWSNANSSTRGSLSNRVQSITADVVFASVNATWKVLSHSGKGNPPRDEKGNPRSWAAEVINGSSDLGLNIMIQHIWGKYESTYPKFYSTVDVMTQYPGNRSQLDKLINVLDRTSRFGVLAVLLITLLFFIYCLRVSSILAILNVVLIICNAALFKTTKKLTLRIYLGSLFILVVTIHGIYQGKFASLLTKKERLPTVDSIDDLARSDHTIYGLNYWDSFFNEPTFEGRFVAIPGYNCTGHVLRDPKAACVDLKLRIISEAVKFKLHLLHEPMGSCYGVHLIRPDWPLKDRINVIHRRITSGDLLKPLFTTQLNGAINELKSYENHEQDRTFRPLAVGQLSFAFVILAIGLGCGGVSFVVEILIHGTPIVSPRICLCWLRKF